MRELKNDRHYKPLEERHENVKPHVKHGIEERRDDERHRKEKELPAEEHDGVPPLRALYLVAVYLLREVNVKIVEHVPLYREKPVKKPYINVLPAVEKVALVMRAQPREYRRPLCRRRVPRCWGTSDESSCASCTKGTSSRR